MGTPISMTRFRKVQDHWREWAGGYIYRITLPAEAVEGTTLSHAGGAGRWGEDALSGWFYDEHHDDGSLTFHCQRGGDARRVALYWGTEAPPGRARVGWHWFARNGVEEPALWDGDRWHARRDPEAAVYLGGARRMVVTGTKDVAHFRAWARDALQHGHFMGTSRSRFDERVVFLLRSAEDAAMVRISFH